MKKISTQEFVQKCREIYGDSYDYSEARYIGSQLPVKIICKVHGLFEKSPNLLTSKRSGCPKCGNAKKGQITKLDPAKVIAEFSEKYPEYTPFELVNGYTNSASKVRFNCRSHGDQVSKISYIRMGINPTPCPVCNVEKSAMSRRTPREDYIAYCNKVHDNKYDYSKTVYEGATSKLTVTCRVHGDFDIVASAHRLGVGCARCFFDKRSIENALPFAEFLENARKVHGDTYTYHEDTYEQVSKKLKITCKVHGDFWQVGTYHTGGSGCPVCAGIGSKGQNEMAEYIRSLGFQVEDDYRIGIGRVEVDCYVPEHNLAIEYDGLKWHSTAHRSVDYHAKKRSQLEGLGIGLVRIFEDEWKTRTDQVKQLLANRLGVKKDPVKAEDCKLVEVTARAASTFHDRNHIQGWNSQHGHSLGLVYQDEVVAVMTFTHKNETNTHELARYSTTRTIEGGSAYILNNAIKYWNMSSIVAYSDNRFFTGNMYKRLGFQLVTITKPSYMYWDSLKNKRLHKSNFRHSKLPKILGDRYNPSLSERANCENAGYFQIYDCGLSKWVLNLE